MMMMMMTMTMTMKPLQMTTLIARPMRPYAPRAPHRVTAHRHRHHHRRTNDRSIGRAVMRAMTRPGDGEWGIK